MERITISNLRRAVEELNERFELNEETPCMIKIHCVYGGYQVIVQQNRPYGSGARDLTIGHVSARECLQQLFERDFNGRVSEDVYGLLIRTKVDYVKRRRAFYD